MHTFYLPEEVDMSQSITRNNFDEWLMPVYEPA
ncbi:MAG: succinylornithine aminotransferase, partial [Gammaproteobacteria bacterium]|nr:succinylornithine aminotransferase [Gammaproteobacteria bacterium]